MSSVLDVLTRYSNELLGPGNATPKAVAPPPPLSYGFSQPKSQKIGSSLPRIQEPGRTVSGALPRIIDLNSANMPSSALPAGLSGLQAATWKAAQAAGIDPNHYFAQIKQESGFDPNAGSPAGAYGIAQVVPHWHPDAPPASNPTGQLSWAAKYMASLLKQYGGSWEKALSVYNSGQPESYLDPDFAKGETYNYVKTILGAKPLPYNPANPPTISTLPNIGGLTTSPTPLTPYAGQLHFSGVSTQGLNQSFVSKLSAAARAVGASGIRLISGYRSPEHNAAVGGAGGSNHLAGRAIDGYAIINGKEVPIGVAISKVADQFGLRSGANDPTFFHGAPDPNHVDDGYNQG